MSLRTDEERLIISVRSEELKYTTHPHKESVCMIDIFSLPKEKYEDPNAIFTSSEVVKCDFLTTNGDPITPPSTIPTKEDLTNEKVEKHEVKTCNLSKEISSICPSIKERLNFWKNKEVLEKNEILKRNNTCGFQIPSSSLEKKEVDGEKNLDVKTIVSFFSPIGNCVRKWATNEFVKDNDEINQEVFKSDNENDLGIHDNEEEEQNMNLSFPDFGGFMVQNCGRTKQCPQFPLMVSNLLFIKWEISYPKDIKVKKSKNKPKPTRNGSDQVQEKDLKLISKPDQPDKRKKSK
ncbi:hypothetical protein Tco_0763412 [Tanacetum coccineum]